MAFTVSGKPDPNSTDLKPSVRTNEQRAAQIRALLKERAGYVTRGLEDRVALVDAQLRALGHEAEKPSERAEKRPAVRGRRSTSR